MIWSNLSPPPTFSATFYPSSAPADSPSSSLRSPSYSSKTIRTIARCSVSSSRNSPATNGGKSAWVRRSANGPCVRNRASMDILLSRGTPRVPQLRSPVLPSPVTTSVQCFQTGYLVCIYRAWSLFLVSSMCSSTVRLADTRSHSPTTLVYGSIGQTSFIGYPCYLSRS